MATKLYKCNTCGKIVLEVMNSGVVPTCCGGNMTLLSPKTTDGALEKHVPVYEKKGSVICITVGAEEHPMTAEHHIEFIILETNKGFYVRYLFDSENKVNFPGACFHLGAGEEPVSVIEYCNIHGLYLSKC